MTHFVLPLRYYIGFFIAASLPLIGAFVSQYGFDLYPCELCIFQRWPYVVAMFFAVDGILLSIFAQKQKKTFPAFVSYAVFFGFILSVLSSGAIGAYHVAVEQKWVQTGCSSSSGLGMSAAELLAVIEATPVVMCDDIAFEFMGISMAGWNVLYALCLSIVAIFVYKRHQQVYRQSQQYSCLCESML